MADAEDTSSQEEKKEIQHEFKKPVLFGRIGKLPKKVKNEPHKSEKAQEEDDDKPKEMRKVSGSDKPKKISTESGSKALPPAVILKDLSTPIPYKEPKWSGLCPDGSDYALEVLKSGCIVDRIDLMSKPYHVFGRLSNCDVVMVHPTISRHHSVLQYKATSSEGEPSPGWYMYELGSTHGTFLNKERLKAAHYTRVRVGHQIKFGNSTRTYIMLGPDFDSEGESELTVSEIKQRSDVMRVERDRMIQEAKEQRERDRVKEEKKRADQGIDWGMGEDAEEEPDLADNPFAVTSNEELYLDDPKKTLRGYFEREGHELTYNCEEKGRGQYICRVELPLDDARGRPVVAEALHTGKKKDAVVAAALEACRVLDRAGLLRQARHESRRRKSRDWSADDYYDSDDDTFLDRTGHVERKRKARMQRHGAEKAENDGPMSYDDLLKRAQVLESQITSEEAVLARLRAAAAAPAPDGADELDAYMDSLRTAGPSMAAKADISRSKMSIHKLKAELSQTNRLAALARAPDLPPLVRAEGAGGPAGGSAGGPTVKMCNSVVYGKRIKLKEDAEKRSKPKPVAVKKEREDEFVEEVDSDEEILETSRVKEEPTTKDPTEIETASVTQSETVKNESQDGAEDRTKQRSEEDSVKKMYGPMRPPENYVIPDDYFDQESDRDLPEIMEK